MKYATLGITLYFGFAVSAIAQEGAPVPNREADLIEDMRAQIQQLRRESVEMRQQLESMRLELEQIKNSTSNTANDKPQSNPEIRDNRFSALAEEQQLLDAKLEDQYQTKVESGSKYRVRLSGLGIFNAFATRGSVDNLDLPRLALSRPLGDSNGSFAFTARQSRINLAVIGPEWKSAKVSGDMSFDFWGGFPTVSDGVSAGLVRLRTANLSLDSTNMSIVAGQDVPFFSPRSPTSLASSAYPALSSAGNLWTWTPQIRVERRIALSDNNRFAIQGGLLDAFTGELPDEYNRGPTAGERSRFPAYAMRFGWQRGEGDRVAAAGAGAYYSRQNWGFSRTVDSWIATADWDLPLGPWFSLSGEFYRGRAIAGLGASASGSVLFVGAPDLSTSSILALNNIGGWSQIKFKPTQRVEFNLALGGDQPFRNGLRALLDSRLIAGAPAGRNSSGFLNIIYQARSNLLLSIEYRRLRTSGFYDPKRAADHVSFTSAIVF